MRFASPCCPQTSILASRVTIDWLPSKDVVAAVVTASAIAATLLMFWRRTALRLAFERRLSVRVERVREAVKPLPEQG